MFKILKTLKAAFNWSAALELASNRDFSSALKKLLEIRSLSDKRIARFVLLEAYLNLKLHQNEEVVTNLNEFFDLIEQDNNYDMRDKDYLVGYAAWIIMSMPSATSSQFSSYDIPKNIDDISVIPLGGIKPNLKRAFPLEIHKRWIN